MQINLSELSRKDDGRFSNWQYSFLLSCLTEHTENCHQWNETLGVDTSKAPIIIDVNVLVNGNEIPFDNWMELMENSYKKSLVEHARLLLKEKMSKIQDHLDKMDRYLEDAVDEIMNGK